MEVGAVAYHCVQVVEGKACVDAVDADGILANFLGTRLLQEIAEGESRFGFLAWRHAVFEIVGDVVDRETPGFVKELFGRRRDWQES